MNNTHRAISLSFLAGTLLGLASSGVAATVLGSSVFDDVERGSFYDSAIGEMYSDGILKGYDGTDNFGPNDYVTRGQVAVMLQRFRDDIDGSNNDDDDDDDNRSSAARSRASSTSSSSSAAAVNNPKGTFRFTTNAFSVNENQNNVTVTVVRVGGADGSVSVNYAVTGNSATAGSDFEAINGTLSFSNKETSKTFSVTIKNDSTSEGNEAATVTLSNVTNGASIGTPSTATLTIVDDEASSAGSSSSRSSTGGSSANAKGTMTFAATAYTFNENVGNATITVVRNGGTSGSVDVNYATSNGTGVSGTEYNATSGTLNFASGESSKTFTVQILDDSKVDGGKTLTLTLSNPTGGATLGTPTSTVTIQDNENEYLTTGSGSFKFSKAEVDASESKGSVDITIMRVGAVNMTTTVQYATGNGTATGGSDYTMTSGTMSFAPGESSKVVTIPITKDSDSDSGETFYVTLSNPSSNAQLVTPYDMTVTIAN